MESRFVARNRAARSVRNRLLPNRLAAVRQCRSWARGILSRACFAGDPTIATAERGNKPLTCHNSELLTGRDMLRRVPNIRGCDRARPSSVSDLDPDPSDNVAIFHRNGIHLLRLTFFV